MTYKSFSYLRDNTVYFHCSENSVNVLQEYIGCCFCKKHREDTNTVRGQNAEFVFLKLAVPRLATELFKGWNLALEI